MPNGSVGFVVTSLGDEHCDRGHGRIWFGNPRFSHGRAAVGRQGLRPSADARGRARRARPLTPFAELTAAEARWERSATLLLAALAEQAALLLVFFVELCEQIGRNRVDDVFRLVEECRDIGAFGLGLGSGCRFSEAAVLPSRVVAARLEPCALAGAPPGRFRRQIQRALPNDLAGLVGPAHIVAAILPHRHGRHSCRRLAHRGGGALGRPDSTRNPGMTKWLDDGVLDDGVRVRLLLPIDKG